MKNALDAGRCSPIRRRDRLNCRSGITCERSRYSRAAYSAKLNYKSVCLTWKPATRQRTPRTHGDVHGSSSGLDIVMSMLAGRGRMDSDRTRSSSDDAGVKAGISDLRRRLGCGNARLYEIRLLFPLNDPLVSSGQQRRSRQILDVMFPDLENEGRNARDKTTRWL